MECLKMDFIFQSCFKLTAKLSRKYRNFLYTPCLSTLASLMVTLSHKSGTFVTTDEPTLTHHHHPKSTVYIRVHSWFYTIYEFGQTYNDMNPRSEYHTKQSHCPKHPLCSTYSSSSSKALAATDSFQSLHGFAFSRCHRAGIMTMQPFQISFFHLVKCI